MERRWSVSDSMMCSWFDVVALIYIVYFSIAVPLSFFLAVSLSLMQELLVLLSRQVHVVMHM